MSVGIVKREDGLFVGQKIFSNGIIDCIPQEIGHLVLSIYDKQLS
jgi:hypothetical protein